MKTKVCTKCGIEKPLDQFAKNSSKPDGLSPQCKECKHKYYEEYYKKNKNDIYKKHRSYKKFLTQYMRQLKSNGCIICGEKDQACLDFHHLHDKSFNIGNQCRDKVVASIKNEVDKCVVLCANCHRKLHFYNLTIDLLKDYVLSGFESLWGNNNKHIINTMELKFKRLEDKAILPIRGTKGAAGIDLTCIKIDTVINEANQLMLVYHTGLAVEIPAGYVGLLIPRSSIWKKSLWLTDNVGVIDSDYRGEIMAVMKATTDAIPAVYQKGERFCQLVIVPVPEYKITEVSELTPTERGDGGFGSTGTDNENECSAATGTQSQLKEQVESVPEQAAAQEGAEVSEGLA